MPGGMDKDAGETVDTHIKHLHDTLQITAAQEGGPLKFTGHERDGDIAGGNTTLDYMHARYYSSSAGR